LPVPEHVAAVSGDDPGNDLHQRGLACAVLAQQQMNLAGSNGKIAVTQRGDTAKSLLNIPEFEEH
jgi:hypothetical protein